MRRSPGLVFWFTGVWPDKPREPHRPCSLGRASSGNRTRVTLLTRQVHEPTYATEACGETFFLATPTGTRTVSAAAGASGRANGSSTVLLQCVAGRPGAPGGPGRWSERGERFGPAPRVGGAGEDRPLVLPQVVAAEPLLCRPRLDVLAGLRIEEAQPVVPAAVAVVLDRQLGDDPLGARAAVLLGHELGVHGRDLDALGAEQDGGGRGGHGRYLQAGWVG